MGITLASYCAAHPAEHKNGAIRVCIGGGAGFIGSHIAKRLKEAVLPNTTSLPALQYIFIIIFIIGFVVGMLCDLRGLE